MKEINLTKTGEDVKFPLSSIGNNIVKIETMLSTLNNQLKN